MLKTQSLQFESNHVNCLPKLTNKKVNILWRIRVDSRISAIQQSQHMAFRIQSKITWDMEKKKKNTKNPQENVTQARDKVNPLRIILRWSQDVGFRRWLLRRYYSYTQLSKEKYAISERRDKKSQLRNRNVNIRTTKKF